MPDLLLELRSEEIPARMQRKAAGEAPKQAKNEKQEPASAEAAPQEGGSQ